MRTAGGVQKLVAFVVLVVVGLAGLVVLTTVDPFGGNVALTALVEAAVVGLVAYLLTFVAVPRRRVARTGRRGAAAAAPQRGRTA